jgi:hypothetical protein
MRPKAFERSARRSAFVFAIGVAVIETKAALSH